MKTLSKILCLVLALALCLGMAACSGTKPAPKPDDGGEDKELTYDELSAKLYDEVLGDFLKTYNKAKEAESISERFALMAVAEAKLMESGVMLPLSSNGGNYAISRVAPYSITPALWGNDAYRYHQALVVKGAPILSEDREALKALWKEKKGTGTYEAEAKAFLASKGYELKDSYTLAYSSDPKTWDVLGTSRSADSEAIINTYDGLYEYDVENVLQPALADSYTVSDDGLTYTFKLKSGLKWVNSQGVEVGDITADDFVAGMQHMMDVQGGLEYLVQGIIKGANEYIGGELTDFAEVGVKAEDDTTLVYTLEAPCTYFMTMLGYGVFAPMNRSYYEAQGGKFGAEFDATAEDYLYGTDPDHIAYCGPYLVTNNTKETKIVFSANESYWNKDNINAKTITWLFNDGKNATKAYEDMKAEILDGAGLNAAALELARQDVVDGTDKTWYDTYHYVSSTDATSFMAFNNINRAVFANVADETKAVSPQSTEDAARTNAAMQNVNFRRALCFAVDRGGYNAQTVGEELKLTSLRNCYTPGTFVSLEEDVTIDINGTATKYEAGTYYGKIMQDQINADGVKMTVWDPNGDSGIGSSDGFDGWYNKDNAVEELNKAIEALKADGIAIDADHPIYIDLPCFTGSPTYVNRGQAYKQSVEDALGGLVKVNLLDCPTADDWYNAGYYTELGSEANYDVYDVSGWGPDYGDPSTYLDTFLPEGAGYMVKCIGIY